MTLPQAQALLEYWGEFPPVHLMVRNYLGIGGTKADEKIERFEDLAPDRQDEFMQKLFALGG